jgi:hypothetical protein
MSKSTGAALAVLAVIGAGTLHGFSIRNGLYDLIDAHKIQGILPNGINDPYKSGFTGLAPLDSIISTLLLFFWPVVDAGRERAGLSALGVLFGGQACAALTMMMIEGMRKGNEGRAVSFITIYASLIQLCGMAVSAPIYLALTVFTSPTFAHPTAANLVVSNIDAIPFGLIAGFIAPSMVMALAYPSLLSLKFKIWSIILWQASPLYAIYISKGLSALSPHKAKTTSKARQLMHLRAAYKFALIVAVPVHISTWILSLSCLLFPSAMFTPKVATSLHPLNALIPPSPVLAYTAKAVDIAQGAQWFLQWDYWVSSLAYIVYAAGAKHMALRKTSLGDIVWVLGKAVVLGPMGVALALLWERDELVLGAVDEKEGKSG